MIQETKETVILKFYFRKCNIDSILIVGGSPRKNYDNLKDALTLAEIYHVPYEQKELKKICKKIYECVKSAKLVVTVSPRHYEMDYHLKEALREHPMPVVHVRGGGGSANILVSLYEKRVGLESILKEHCGEI